jgi:TorA maturation chaperone TorD
MTMDFSDTLSLLSSMYLCKPAKEALENWKALLSGDVPDYMRDMKNAVDEINPGSEQELEDLLWEYTRLFIGPYKLPSPPWESVYTSPKRLMMQDAHTEIQRLYGEAGLAMNNADIMADHIGAELNFMAVLCRKRDAGNEKDISAPVLKTLLHDHLLKWAPSFAHDMESAAESPFYKALALATGRLLQEVAAQGV